MANLKVNVLRLCKTDKGWKRYPVVYGKTKLIKPETVLVDGKEVKFPVGRYQLCYRKGRKVVFENAGEHAANALQMARSLESKLQTKVDAKAAGLKVVEEGATTELTLARELQRFVVNRQSREKYEAAETVNLAALEFLKVTGKTYPSELHEDDMTAYHAALFKRGLSARTVANRHSRIVSWFKFMKLDSPSLAGARPQFEEALPEIYTDTQLQALLGGAEAHQALTLEMYLRLGLRYKELKFAEWKHNVFFDTGIFRVRGNPKWKFKPKAYHQRDVPIPKDLLEKMRQYHAAHPEDVLINGTAGGLPNPKTLRALKRLARRLGLNCGTCEGCLHKNKECRLFFLHKFRATCLTKLLRQGFDLRTVMRFSGHKTLEAVIRYLTPMSNDEIKTRIDSMVWF